MNEQDYEVRQTDPTPPKSSGRITNAFLTGIFVCLPITLTAYIIVWSINAMAAPARGVLNTLLHFLNIEIPQDNALFNAGVTLVAAAIVAVSLTIIGFVSRYVFGKWFLNRVDKILLRVPMARSIYSAIKQIVDTFGVRDKQTYSKVVFVEFPRKDCWTLGFLTSEEETKFDEIIGAKLIHVFVPTTPNPTGGYMILVPAYSVKYLDITVAEAMKMIVSGGAVIPEIMKKHRGEYRAIATPRHSEGE